MNDFAKFYLRKNLEVYLGVKVENEIQEIYLEPLHRHTYLLATLSNLSSVGHVKYNASHHVSLRLSMGIFVYFIEGPNGRSAET